MGVKDSLLFLTVLAVACLAIGCGGGTATVVSGPASGPAAGEPGPGQQSATWPAGLPVDRLQPWEVAETGHATAATGGSAFLAGYECYTAATGCTTEQGSALRMASTAVGSGSVAWACYRVPMNGAQPGLLTADVNPLPGGDGSPGTYYIGLSDYSAGAWEWHGPFGTNQVRLGTGAAVAEGHGYLSAVGNTFVCIVAHGGSGAEVIALGAEPVDPADTTPPAQPMGLVADPVVGGLDLRWNLPLTGGLAGYRVMYSAGPFTETGGKGVNELPTLVSGNSYLLGGVSGTVHVRVSAVDVSGNESEPSEMVTAVVLTGDSPPEVAVTADRSSVLIDDPVQLTATGAGVYTWDLDGDGRFDISGDTGGSQPAETGRTGVVRPTVRGTQGDGSCVAEAALSMIVDGNQRPAAAARVTPASGTAPLAVQFTGSASTDFDGELVAGGWDFDGDGTYDVWDDEGTGAINFSNHTYETAGVYNAKLRVVDDDGAWDVHTVAVTVGPVPDPENVAPQAMLQINPSTGDVPHTVTLSGELSSDSDGTIVEYAFDVDDDWFYEEFSESQHTLQHTYTMVGYHSVRLRVTDDDGATHTMTQIVHVTDPANPSPEADLAVSPGYCDEGEVVTFNASLSSDEGSIVKYEWDFDGDGSFDEYGSDPIVTHIYNSPGSYNATVRVTDDGGAQDQASNNAWINKVFHPDHIWDRARFNNWNTGRCPYLGPQTPNIIWSFDLEGDYCRSTPLIARDGTIYLTEYDNNIYALNPDGSLKWSLDLYDALGNMATLGPDGTLYIGSANFVFYAISPEGELKWEYTTGDTVFTTPLVGLDGMLYFGSQDGYLYAVSPSGQLAWSLDTGEGVGGMSQGDDGTIYVGGSAAAAISSSGVLLWSHDLSIGAMNGPAIGVDGTLYYCSSNHDIYAFNPDGSQRWSYDAGVSSNTMPAIAADGTVYAGDHDGNLYAFSPGGTLLWTETLPDDIVSSPVIDAAGTVYFGCYDGNVYAYNPDGTMKWSETLGGYISASPAIGADGVLYVGCYLDGLYAIGESVGNTPPTADLTADKTTSHAPFLINFDASGSLDNDGFIVNYEWDFDGDGNYEEAGESPTATHTYPERGWFRAKVKVTDEDGDSDTADLDITLPSEWACFGAREMNNGPSWFSGPVTANTEWTYTAPAESLSGQAVLDAYGNVYFGSLDNKVYCLDPDGGNVWTHTGADDMTGVAMADDGKLVVTCADGYVYFLNGDGTAVNSVDLGADSYCPAIGPDGCIYTGNTNGDIQVLYPDGSLKWTDTVSGPIYAVIALGEDGTVYVPTQIYSYSMYAYNPDGTQQWSYYYNAGYTSRIKPTVTEGYIYYGNNENRIIKLNRSTGDTTPGGWQVGLSTGRDINSMIALDADGHLYFGCDDDDIHKRYTAAGNRVGMPWPYETGGDVNCSPVIDADGRIYCGSDDGYVYAIDTACNDIWSYDTGSAVIFVILDRHGSLYAGCANGNLVKFHDI